MTIERKGQPVTERTVIPPCPEVESGTIVTLFPNPFRHHRQDLVQIDQGNYHSDFIYGRAINWSATCQKLGISWKNRRQPTLKSK